jgi:PadR family transcriptional regulator PadR
MDERQYPGVFEEIVLLAILRLRDDAYGMRIRQVVEEATGRATAIGAIYTTLDRLEQKGYIGSRPGEATPERGNRVKKYFEIKAAGVQALNEVRRARELLSGGLVPAGGVV